MMEPTIQEHYLNSIQAALHLGITPELLTYYTGPAFHNSTGLPSLKTHQSSGATVYLKSQLETFNNFLMGEWPHKDNKRAHIPQAVKEHLKAEASNACARCSGGRGIEYAHIIPWAESKSNHHENLIRICSLCHAEHDIHKCLPTEELRELKNRLVAKTRHNLLVRIGLSSEKKRAPSSVENFIGRTKELSELSEALKSNQSILITGIGGIGKTELLKQALNRVSDSRPVLWIDVEKHLSLINIMAQLRMLLGNDGIACPEDQIATQLDGQNAILVLDGIEQAAQEAQDDIEDTFKEIYSHTRTAQIIITSQVNLHSIPFSKKIKVDIMELEDSRKLLELTSEDRTNDPNALLDFCNGHPLTLKIASALSIYYDGYHRALKAINSVDASRTYLPGRSKQNRSTSLKLCLLTAYDALSLCARYHLWALSQSPAGLTLEYLEAIFSSSNGGTSPTESLAELRRWHLVSSNIISDNSKRYIVLNPVSSVVIELAKKRELGSYNLVIEQVVTNMSFMMHAWDEVYSSPYQTPELIERCKAELPNLLNLIRLANLKNSTEQSSIFAVGIATSLMPYFFVNNLPQQGAQVLLEGAKLALSNKLNQPAARLILQFISHATRSHNESFIELGLSIATKLEKQTDNWYVLAEIEMVKSIAEQYYGNLIVAKDHALQAIKLYEKDHSLSSVSENTLDDIEVHVNDRDNNLSHAWTSIGHISLAERNPEEAKKAYSKALKYMTSGSAGVNQGQLLHQLGNCESVFGNNEKAASYYVQASNIFHFVGMKEYLGNAVGELGHSLKYFDGTEIAKTIEANLLEDALNDIIQDSQNIFLFAQKVPDERGFGNIRKLFGILYLTTLKGEISTVKQFCNDLLEKIIKPIELRFEEESSIPNLRFYWARHVIAYKLAALTLDAENLFIGSGSLSSKNIEGLAFFVGGLDGSIRDQVTPAEWLTRLAKYRWGFNSKKLDEILAMMAEADPWG